MPVRQYLLAQASVNSDCEFGEAFWRGAIEFAARELHFVLRLLACHNRANDKFDNRSDDNSRKQADNEK